MKRHVHFSASVFILVIFSICTGCLMSHDRLCCLEYNPDTDRATYCNNFRNTVIEFVNEANDYGAKRNRLDEMKALYGIICDCGTVACINEVVDTQTGMRNFKKIYYDEKMFSERDTNIPDYQKAGLILCGFRHGIEAVERTF